MTQRLAPKVSQEEYDALSAVLGADPEFPENYEVWLDRMSTGEPVEITAAEFSQYCESIGQPENMATLGAFVAFKGSKEVHR